MGSPWLHPKIARDRITAWLDERGRHPGPLWPGQRGPLTISGIVQVALALGAAAGIPGLRPQRCRHTYATRLRQGGADVAPGFVGCVVVDRLRYLVRGPARVVVVLVTPRVKPAG
jgi:integrase